MSHAPYAELPLPPLTGWDAWRIDHAEDAAAVWALPSCSDLPPLHEPGVPDDELHARWRRDLTHWMLGTVPDAPDAVWSEVIETTHGPGWRHERISVSWDRASLEMELLIPAGVGPFPVYMTQTTHREWAVRAVARGYMGVLIPTCDDTDVSPRLVDAYSAYDWSLLRCRAWAASRCVDALLTRSDVWTDQIAFVGHSRNGKQALMCSAFDARLGAVIASSPGQGGAAPARLQGACRYTEGLEAITRLFPTWFHPRWRLFAGREDRLPVDAHQLIALSASRPVLLSTALKDPAENPWAIHVAASAIASDAVERGAPVHVDVLWRQDTHDVESHHLEAYLDWLDGVFGRGERPPLPCAPFNPIVTEDWAWRHLPPGSIADALGERSLRLPAIGTTYGVENPGYAAVMGREVAPSGTEKRQTMMPGGIPLDVYVQPDPAPLVLFLGPWGAATGYRTHYQRGPQMIDAIAAAGYTVAAYDCLGSGRRVQEMAGFHRRYPSATVLGRMVDEGHAAIDAATKLLGAEAVTVDVVGFGTGATVATILAGEEARIVRAIGVAPPALCNADAMHGAQEIATLAFPPRFVNVPFAIDDALSQAGGRAEIVSQASVDPFGPETQALVLARLARDRANAVAQR